VGRERLEDIEIALAQFLGGEPISTQEGKQMQNIDFFPGKQYFLLIAVVSGVCFPSVASAEIYCLADQNVRVFDGQETSVNWTVVTTAARRPQIPGQQRPTTGCAFSWQTLGAMFRPIEIIQNTKLGRTQIGPRYRIFYSSDKPGADELVVRLFWVKGTTSALATGTVRYHITVLDHPI
jgi:hypothetical protein